MDQTQSTSGWILSNSQVYPAGIYEWFNPSAGTGEAHFYMECANKGICDRSTGACTCFDGFDGSACQRASCANKCNGHGTCQSQKNFGIKAEGTLFGKRAEAKNFKTSYDLWDARKGFSCMCDSGFAGADCSQRKCKVGVDPLYGAAGTPILETFLIHATMLAVAGDAIDVSSYIRLQVWDYDGESYITQQIPLVDQTAVPTIAQTIETKLKALPNGIFQKGVDCEIAGTSGTFAFAISNVVGANWLGMIVACRYTSNPGRQRIPIIQSMVFNKINTAVVSTVASGIANQKVFVTGTYWRGEDTDWFATASAFTYTSKTSSTVQVIAGTGSIDIPSISLVKIRDQIVLAATCTTTTLTLAYGFTSVAPAAGSALYKSSATVVADALTVTLLKFGGNLMTLSAASGSTMTEGALIFINNQFFYVLDITGAAVTLDRNFIGPADVGPGVAVYVVTPPADNASGTYKYVEACSARGLCAADTGVCACFKGYTNDNCDTQNIISL